MKKYEDIFPQSRRDLGKKKIKLGKKEFDDLRESLVKENSTKKRQPKHS